MNVYDCLYIYIYTGKSLGHPFILVGHCNRIPDVIGSPIMDYCNSQYIYICNYIYIYICNYMYILGGPRSHQPTIASQ